MKRIDLISIDSCKATIGDYSDFYQCPESMDKYPGVVNSDKFILDRESVIIEYIPVQLVVDHGVEHYIAVKNKVWEYLYLIENPVTAKSQEAKIKKLSKDVDSWYREADKMATCFNKLKNNIHNASLWRRIKWVFKGFNYYD